MRVHGLGSSSPIGPGGADRAGKDGNKRQPDQQPKKPTPPLEDEVELHTPTEGEQPVNPQPTAQLPRPAGEGQPSLDVSA